VDAAAASVVTLAVGGGVSGRVLRVRLGGRLLDVGLRADALAMDLELSRAGVHRSRWLSAFDLLAEASWPIGPHFEIAVGVGAEVAAGPTEVAVAGVPVDHIPVGRTVAELGVRFPF
jgi:hypothetical protein